MSLLSNLPVIDDRTYDDLVAEIRSRIPSYTPEWVPDRWDDYNESDPGIVFAQLVAWLTEMQLYRMSKVPEQNYVRFLELLGIELRAAQPAGAEITFPVKATHTEASVVVPTLTRVEAEIKDAEGKPIVFETDASLTAIRASITAVMPRQDALQPLQNLVTLNEAADLGFDPFGIAVRPDSELMLGFSESLPPTQIDLAVWVAEAETGNDALLCGSGEFQYPSADLRWEFWSTEGWSPLNLLKDETNAFERSGHLVFDGPNAGDMVDVVIGDVDAFWIRAVVERSEYTKAPRLLAIRTNTVAATQAETIEHEVLGATDGSPGQLFTLANTPVLMESLQVEIDEGFEDTSWEAHEDLLGSGPRDRHYALNAAAGQIHFGDGRRHGTIPVANPESPTSNVVARSYRFGGGSRGNLSAGQLNSLTTTIPGIDTENVGNVFASVGGRDEQTIEEAREAAANSLKSKERAVTAEDFETLATSVGQIRRARALPLHHPDFPETTIPGVVTVIVVPDSTDPMPMPSAGMMRGVCECLDERRLLTTEVYVAKPTYVHVEVCGRVIAPAGADIAEIKTAVEGALTEYFHPLRGGDDETGWPFGGGIFYSKVYQRVLLPGVDRIDELKILIDGKERPECSNIALDPGVLTYSTGHAGIKVEYDVGDVS